MHVVGGTYTETCIDPTSSRLLGSALRAALINRDRLEQFSTLLEAGRRPELEATLGLSQDFVSAGERPEPIEFVYETPIARPATYGNSGPTLTVEADAEDVLVFGMIEGVPKVSAHRAVVDPQSSMSVDEIRSCVEADELVIVANVRELCAMTRSADLLQGIELLAEATGASGVVVKAGIGGCLVSVGTGLEFVAPIPTERVWPIGSGDSFSAGFARAWFEHGDVFEAARAGSSQTAFVCATDQLAPALSPVIPKPSLAHLGLDDLAHQPRVYLAASFASTHQRWLLRHVRRKMVDIGINAFSPLHENGLFEGDANDIATKDLAGLESCESILILADGSRTGPWVEAGWGAKLGLPVVIFSEDNSADRYTMLVGTGAEVVQDLATAVYRAGWLALAGRGRK